MYKAEQNLPDHVDEPSEQTKQEEQHYNAWEQRFNDQNKYHDDF